ncbi:MAG: hypothetical protein ACXWRZ_08170 [Bdellovibrio sp.]
MEHFVKQVSSFVNTSPLYIHHTSRKYARPKAVNPCLDGQLS